jgi:hypothetical protein
MSRSLPDLLPALWIAEPYRCTVASVRYIHFQLFSEIHEHPEVFGAGGADVRGELVERFVLIGHRVVRGLEIGLNEASPTSKRCSIIRIIPSFVNNRA